MGKELDNIDNLIEGLESELEWLRQRGNPMDAHDHKIARIHLTLAQSIKELRESTKEPSK